MRQIVDRRTVLKALSMASAAAALCRAEGIAVAFFVPVIGLVFLDNEISAAWLADRSRFAGLVLGSVAVVLLGFADDVRGLGPWGKLAGQVLIAVLAWTLGYRIGVVANPFGDPIVLGALSFPVTLLWIVGIMNAPVLPVPVCAIPTMSRPSAAAGMAFRWIGVGTFQPRSSMEARVASERPSSWKVGFCSSDCTVACVLRSGSSSPAPVYHPGARINLPTFRRFV